MMLRLIARFTVLVSCTLILSTPGAWAQGAQGIRIFEEHCATCHMTAPDPERRIPSRDALRLQTPEAILEKITTGSMAPNAQALSADQKRLVAEFLAGRPIGAAESGAA